MSVRLLNIEGPMWQIDIYPPGLKGKRRRINFRGNKSEADQLELELSRQYQHSIPKNPMIKQAIPDWLVYCQSHLADSTYDNIKKALKNLRPIFGNLRFSMLLPTNIDRYILSRRADGVKDRTINKELSYLSSLQTWAAKNGYTNGLALKIELIKGVKRPPLIILTIEEVQGIIKNIEPAYLCILLLNYDTALRRSEGLRLKAEDIDLGNNTFNVLGKGGKYATVQISTTRLSVALAVMKEKVGTGYLFLNPKTNKPYYSIRKALIRAAQKAGITKRVYVHLLRHSFCTHGLEAGVSLSVMQELLRHSSSKVTEFYRHLSGKHQQSQIKKFSSIVERDQGPMVRIVSGKRYDTEKASNIESYSNDLSLSDADYCHEVLYLTGNGNWFLVGEGGPRTRYADNGKSIGRKLLPLSTCEARTWLEDRNFTELLDQHFLDEIEDA